MASSFSWGDTARAAFATCFACFPQSRSDDSEDGVVDNQRNTRAGNGHRDELESLLRSAEYSDGEMDADAVSLHSDVGSGRRNPRQKRRRMRRKHHNKGTIRLFGYDLFGKPLHASQLEDDYSDEEGTGDAEVERRRIARLSSSTLDSDPTPVEDDIIARLSAGRRAAEGQSQGQASQLVDSEGPQDQQEEAASAAAARKAARKERKRQRKLSSALLNAETNAEFEGFQGSGWDSESVHPSSAVGVPSSSSLSPSSSGFPLQDEFGAFQEARSPLSLSHIRNGSGSGSRPAEGDDGFVKVSRDDVEDEAEDNADFDAVAYVARRNSIVSRTESGSGSRSHTSVSRSEDARLQLRLPPTTTTTTSRTDALSSPMELNNDSNTLTLNSKPSKKARRDTTSGHSNGGSDGNGNGRQPRKSRRSTTAGTASVTSASTTGSGSNTTTLSSSSQPHSPQSDIHPSDPKITQPSEHNYVAGLRLPQHNPAFEGVPEDDGENSMGSGSAMANTLPGPAVLKSPMYSPGSGSGFPSPSLSTGGGGFPSVGLGGRRNSSAMAGSGVFLARTGDDE